MEVPNDLKKFLEDTDNQKLLNDCSFEELYKRLHQKLPHIEATGDFSALMYEINVDPLLYLDAVPKYFLCSQSSMHDIEIPRNIKSIGNSAFYHCSGLTNITIPDRVTTIDDSVLCNCTGLTSITIPDSVTTIGKGTFENCSKLTEIHFNGTKDQWRNIKKSAPWHDGCPLKAIHCTDGDVNFRSKI